MFRHITFVVIVALLLAACGNTAPASSSVEATAPAAAAAPTAEAQPTAMPQPTAGAAEATAAPQATAANTQQLREITVAMPYIPNVQFAQFYVAEKQGYYAAQGLKITFDYNFETDV